MCVGEHGVCTQQPAAGTFFLNTTDLLSKNKTFTNLSVFFKYKLHISGMLLVSRCSGMLRDAAVDHGVLDLVLTFLQIPAASIMIFYYKGLQSKRCATRDDFRHSVTCDVLKYLFECFGACYERVWKNKCLTLCVKGELVLCVEGGGGGVKSFNQ